jgi:hypothetical protein
MSEKITLPGPPGCALKSRADERAVPTTDRHDSCFETPSGIGHRGRRGQLGNHALQSCIGTSGRAVAIPLYLATRIYPLERRMGSALGRRDDGLDGLREGM